jgi:hypothetical protein
MRRPACFSMHTVLQDKAVPPHSFPISYIMEETNSTKQKKNKQKKQQKNRIKNNKLLHPPLFHSFFSVCARTCAYFPGVFNLCVSFFFFSSHPWVFPSLFAAIHFIFLFSLSRFVGREVK